MISGSTGSGKAERDSKLVLRIRQGDQRAFRELFDHYHPIIFRFCARYTKLDRDQVSDVVQHTFILAYERIGDLRDARRVGPWMLTIARNQVISLLRRQQSERRAMECLAREPGGESDDDRYFREQMLLAIEETVGEVADETTRQFVELYYGPDGLTTQAIADRLHIPKGTVTVKLMRLRQRVHCRLVRRMLEHDLLEGALPCAPRIPTGAGGAR